MNNIITRPKVSVTVPVYNTSKYLIKCLESLRVQTLKNIEFILVDDGSTDDSGQICDQFANQDSRFKVIHQSNGGLSKARQVGLEQAKGEYIIVCDSDDWVEPTIYEKLYNAAKETGSDMVFCGHYAEYQDGRSVAKYPKYNLSSPKALKYGIIKNGNHNSWSKLIKRELYDITNSSYTKGINLGEDALIIYKLLTADPKVNVINECLYHYRRLKGETSYTNKVKWNHLQQMIYVYRYLQENYTDPAFSEVVFRKAIDVAFTGLRVVDVDLNSYKSFLKEEIPIKRLLSIKFTPKTFMVLLSKILPYRVSSGIFSVIYPFVYK